MFCLEFHELARIIFFKILCSIQIKISAIRAIRGEKNI
ncbi:Uncharacterised protein [Flavobacterium hibernum]|nr:Uncharacterised protein [Flavobacterium hibernum]